MDLDDLENALEELFPAGFELLTDKNGQLVVYTGLAQGDDGELIEMDEFLEEDLDLDPNFEPLKSEDDDED